jgi:hypothetical protein
MKDAGNGQGRGRGVRKVRVFILLSMSPKVFIPIAKTRAREEKAVEEIGNHGLGGLRGL